MAQKLESFHREMKLANQWPEMEYVTCESYSGSNTPDRSLDLKSFFVNATEQPTYGTFALNNNSAEFNGYSMLKFNMDILGVAVRNGSECREKNLGNWKADFASPFHMDSMKDMGELNLTKIYRVSTVVVKYLCVAIHIQTILD